MKNRLSQQVVLRNGMYSWAEVRQNTDVQLGAWEDCASKILVGGEVAEGGATS